MSDTLADWLSIALGVGIFVLILYVKWRRGRK